MSWFRVDDKFFEHPKALRAGKDARNLWFRVGVSCASFNTDGRVDGEIVAELAPQAGVTKWKAATVRLVEVGLWHDHRTVGDCNDCATHLRELNADRKKHDEPELKLAAGDFFFHQWWAYQEQKKARRSAAAKLSEDRRRALLRDADLCRQIQLRDNDHCRYCGCEVNWNDRRSATRPTYDHVDPHCYEPNGGNFLDNVVTACATCNGRKGQRTPEAWAADPKRPGFHLLPPYEPPPAQYRDVTPVTKPDPKPVPDLTGPGGSDPENLTGPPGSTPENLTGPPGFDPKNLTGPSRDARLGSGRVGSDPGTGLGTDRAGRGRAGPGLVGLVRGEAGPGADGTGLVGFGPGREPPPGGPADSPPDRTCAAADGAEDSIDG